MGVLEQGMRWNGLDPNRFGDKGFLRHRVDPREADEEPVRLTGQLVKVGERVVFDLVAGTREGLVIPGHFFMLVEKTPAGVTFHWLDSEWLRDQLIGPKSPAHVMARGKPVLTAESARLNAFLAEFGLDPKAVSGSMIFNRLKQN